MKKNSLLAALLLALSFTAGAAYAEKADRNKPIHFSANKSEAINYETKVATLSGNVVITQGTMTMRADRVTIRQNEDNTLSAKAWGKPVQFRQKRDNTDEFMEAYAERVEFDGKANLLELFEQAMLKRDADEIRSNYISYNTETEVFRADGRQNAAPTAAEPPGRVTGTFRIQEKGEADVKNPSVNLKTDTQVPKK
jgi:lipopolysaccharide export system protein LptA